MKAVGRERNVCTQARAKGRPRHSCTGVAGAGTSNRANRHLRRQAPLPADDVGSGIAILVGGKISNRISKPKFSKVVIPFIPNEPPRWPSTVDAVKKILNVYAKDAEKYERIGDWAERIGWERFFEKCDLPFTHHLIDD